MRDLSWKVFTVTGDVDAYLLYKGLETTDSEYVLEPSGEETEEEE